MTNFEEELQKVSYFTEPHAHGTLGRWLTADEIISEWAARARDWDNEFESAQHRLHLTAFGVGTLAFIAGFGICWLVFVR